MRYNLLLGVFLSAICLMSCGRHSKDVEYKVSLMPCFNEKTEEYGYINHNGHFMPVRPCDEMTPVINGFCVIDGTLYKVDNSISDTIPIIRDIETCGIMNNGLIPVCRKNEQIFIADVAGKEIFRLKEFDGKEVIACYSYSDEKLRVILEDQSYIYVDKSGKQLFDTKYKWTTDFKNGYAIVQNEQQNEGLFSLIDKTGTPVFTFECDDSEYITISHDLNLLSAKTYDKIVIYDFRGKRILDCPSKVKEIYAFCYDGFVYVNEDDEFGLMSYEGEVLIRAKYEQLVPHGRNYLVLTDEDEILLINKEGSILKDWDGDEILDFHHEGFEFNTIIETEYDGYISIDKDGKIITDEKEDIWGPDGISELCFIRSRYIPERELLNTILELCRDGAGLSDKYGAFFGRYNPCIPSDITFAYLDKSLEGWPTMGKTLSKGINYEFSYLTYFNQSIIKQGEISLNPNATLLRVLLMLRMTYEDDNQEFIKKCVNEFKNKGCIEYYRNGNDSILCSTDRNLLYVLFLDKGNRRSFVQIMPNIQSERDYWKNELNSYHSK